MIVFFFFLIQIENHLLNKNNLFHVSRLLFFFLQLKTCYFYDSSSRLFTIFFQSSSNSLNIRIIDKKLALKNY